MERRGINTCQITDFNVTPDRGLGDAATDATRRILAGQGRDRSPVEGRIQTGGTVRPATKTQERPMFEYAGALLFLAAITAPILISLGGERA